MVKRNLYLHNTPVEEARELYLTAIADLARPQAETIAVVDSLSRVTARAVYARLCSPLFNASAMDGIAVVAKHTAAAEESRPLRLQRGEGFLVVDTGDPIKPPYDAVIMAEDVFELDADTVEIIAAAAPWQHVRPIGEDIVAGEMILPGFHRIRPMDISVLLAGGITEVEVNCRPRVAILPTGSEIIEPGQEPGEGGIIESNSRMFAAMVSEAGGVPDRYSIIPDDYDLLKQTIAEAVKGHDVVLVNAGSSAGSEDYTVHVLRDLGQVLVHGVAVKPGKPLILAIVDNTPVIGLPGYPVSAYIDFELFVQPLLASYTGLTPPPPEQAQAVITRRLVSSLKHREYVRVKVGKVNDRLVASPLARGAGAAMSLTRADGFCVIPQESEGVEAGDTVRLHLTGSLADIEHTLVAIGSHDLIMDVIADLLPSQFRGMHLSSTHVGSMGGLLALMRGEAHLAPTHLLDEQSGEYNAAFIGRILPGRNIALIKGVQRIQGLIVAKGNPLAIRGIEDLPGKHYINRQRGAGTRVLLDYLLQQAGMAPTDIEGYEREATTHMAVAAAVNSGGADAGMGVLSAARALDLDFVPVGPEEYDFAMPAEFLELPATLAFLEVLHSEAFRARLGELGGYAWPHLGEIVRL
jgi:putative molybdopterin biosynthesis protein